MCQMHYIERMKKMRKRMVAALLAATMVLGLTACGGSDSGSDPKSEGDGKTVMYMWVQIWKVLWMMKLKHIKR